MSIFFSNLDKVILDTNSEHIQLLIKLQNKVTLLNVDTIQIN